MTSKNFSSNKLLWNNMRRNLWTFVLSIFAFVLSLLLPMLMLMQRALDEQQMGFLTEDDIAYRIEEMRAMLAGDNILVKLAFVGLAVVCGVAMFSYLHSRQKVDFYHSMPITRTRLYINQFVTGIVSVVTSYLIVLVITIGVTYAMGFGAAVDWTQISSAVTCDLIIFFLLYSLTVVTTIVCGNTIISLLLLLWTMFSLLAVRALYLMLCGQFLVTHVGMSEDNTIAMFKLSPVVQYFMLNGTTYYEIGNYHVGQSALGLLAVYLLVGVAAAVLGWYLFRIRKSERAGMALAFEPLRLPLKVYICIVMGVAVALFFWAVGGWFWFWPGLVIGAALFHGITEMIYAFDMKAIIAKPLHLVCILVVLVGGILMMEADVFGYDTRLPKEDQVQAASLRRNYDMQEDVLLTEEQNVKAIYKLMQHGVEAVQVARSIQDDGYADIWTEEANYTTWTISYRKANGRVEMRDYLIKDCKETDGLIQQVMDSAEYKEKNWDLFRVDLDEMGSTMDLELRFINNANQMSEPLQNPEKVKKIIETLREETLTHTAVAKPMIRIEFDERYQAGNAYYSKSAFITEADVKTLALVKEYAGFEPENLRIDGAENVSIEYETKVDGGWTNKSVEVTDPQDIAKLIENAYNESVMSGYSSGWRSRDRIMPREYAATTVISTEDDYYRLAYLPGQEPIEVLKKYGIPMIQDEKGGAADTNSEATVPVEAVPYAQ